MITLLLIFAFLLGGEFQLLAQNVVPIESGYYIKYKEISGSIKVPPNGEPFEIDNPEKFVGMDTNGNYAYIYVEIDKLGNTAFTMLQVNPEGKVVGAESPFYNGFEDSGVRDGMFFMTELKVLQLSDGLMLVKYVTLVIPKKDQESPTYDRFYFKAFYRPLKE